MLVEQEEDQSKFYHNVHCSDIDRSTEEREREREVGVRSTTALEHLFTTVLESLANLLFVQHLKASFSLDCSFTLRCMFK